MNRCLELRGKSGTQVNDEVVCSRKQQGNGQLLGLQGLSHKSTPVAGGGQVASPRHAQSRGSLASGGHTWVGPSSALARDGQELPREGGRSFSASLLPLPSSERAFPA